MVFTTDDDFLVETVRRQRVGQPFGGVVYAHQTRVTVGRCVSDLELIDVAAELSEYLNPLQNLPP